MKICIKCKDDKDIKEFYKKKDSKDGRSVICKPCHRAYTALHRDSKKANKYYIDNKERILTKKKTNIVEIRKKDRIYYQDNIVKMRLKSKRYYERNKVEMNRKANIYVSRKYREDPIFRIKNLLRSRIRLAMKSSGYKKSSRTEVILGIDYKSFIIYISSMFTEGMTLDKMGKHIHIDHKIPLASAKTEEELIKLCHYTNLQPLWAEDNLKKGAKLEYY